MQKEHTVRFVVAVLNIAVFKGGKGNEKNIKKTHSLFCFKSPFF